MENQPNLGNSLWLRIALCAIGASLLAGCSSSSADGPKRFPVYGKVTLDGAPVEQGSITLVPDAPTSGPSAGASITGGTYTIPADSGPVAGKYLVRITASKKTGKQVPAGSPSPPGTMTDETVESVPAKYNTASTLKVEFPVDKNTKDFELSTK